MASFREIADGYLQRLVDARDEQAEISAIAADIHALTYQESGRSISAGDKLVIVEIMEGRLSAPKPTPIGRVGILKEADNKRYLVLVSSLRNLLG